MTSQTIPKSKPVDTLGQSRNDINLLVERLNKDYDFDLKKLNLSKTQQESVSKEIADDYEQIQFNLELLISGLEKYSQGKNEKVQDLNLKEKNTTKIFHEKIKNENDDLRKENEKLKNKNQSLVKKIDKLKEKNEQLKREESRLYLNKNEFSLFEENLNMKKKNDELKKKFNNLEEKMKDEANELAKTKEKLLKMKEKLDKKRKDIKNLQSKNSDQTAKIKSLKDKNDSLKVENKNLEEEISSLKSKTKERKAQPKESLTKMTIGKSSPHPETSISLNPYLEKSKAKIRHNSSQKSAIFHPYDLVINLDSLKCSKIGWEIEDHNVAESHIRSRDFSIVGFFGRENIGKTYILNKICGFDLPSGTNVNTKGLSLKYATERNIICLDSAGMQTPVYYYDSKLMQRYEVSKEQVRINNDLRIEMLNDRTLTDVFIQDFILEVAEVIIIVVGQLAQNDQKLIERIQSRYGAKKKIIVIHNFANLQKKKDVERKIKKDILQAFDVIRQYIPSTEVTEFIEKNNDKAKENIVHLVLGCEDHESGAFFNAATIKHIKNRLDALTEKREFNLTDALNNFIASNWHRYLKFQKRPEKGVCLEYKNEKIMIKAEDDYAVSNPSFNSLGSLVTNPPFEVLAKDSQYVCLAEIADLEKDSLKIKLEQKKTDLACLLVLGSKKENKMKNESFLPVTGMRTQGNFMYRFPLGPAHLQLKINTWVYNDGVLEIKVDIDRSDEVSILL